MQLLLRLQPLCDMVKGHGSDGDLQHADCSLCHACVEVGNLRALVTPAGDNAFALLARGGVFGDAFRGHVDGPVKKRKKSGGRGPAPQCDAREFMDCVLGSFEKRELASSSGDDVAFSSSLVRELFGHLERQRYHCLGGGCTFPTEDRCFSRLIVDLEFLTADRHQEKIKLQALWDHRFGNEWHASEPTMKDCCGVETVTQRVDYFEAEPPVLLLHVKRATQVACSCRRLCSAEWSCPTAANVKIVVRVQFPRFSRIPSFG